MTTSARKGSTAETYRFRLLRDGVDFEVEGDRQFVLDLVSQFAGSFKGEGSRKVLPKNSEQPILPPDSQKISGKGLSIREFISAFDIKKHTDYVLAFGYFLEQHGGQESFTPADINSLYYEAKLESSNTSQMLIQNIKRGYVMEAKNNDGGRKKYLLTTSGEKYINQKRAASE